MKLLILDCNYLCHTVLHTMPAFTYNDNCTQIIFGFIKRVMSLADKFKSDNIAFTWDSKSSIRKAIYPKYKEVRLEYYRKATEEEKQLKRLAYLQFDDIRDSILTKLGFSNVFIQDGYEADDLIASIVKSNPDEQITVVTTDKDMYQIITDNCRMFSPASNILFTKKLFESMYGCEPKLWGEAKAIAGCSTDNVEGVKGVGEKTAIKYLLGKMNEKSKTFKEIESLRDLIILNRELVILPMHGTDEIEINRKNNLSRSKFVSFCEEYGFKSLLNQKTLDKWDSIIAGA